MQTQNEKQIDRKEQRQQSRARLAGLGRQLFIGVDNFRRQIEAIPDREENDREFPQPNI